MQSSQRDIVFGFLEIDIALHFGKVIIELRKKTPQPSTVSLSDPLIASITTCLSVDNCFKRLNVINVSTSITGTLEEKSIITSIRISRHLLSHEFITLQVQTTEIEFNLSSYLLGKVSRHYHWIL